jgi:hypothetical protein
MQNVNNVVGEIFVVDAPGGTGKTFLRKLIQAASRSYNDIAVALASSGIAATLLPGGRTAESALKVSLNMQCTETPTCNMFMLRVPGSANQTIYISAQQMEPQKLLFTHRHWDIKRICSVGYLSLRSLPLHRKEPQQRVAGYS